MISIAKYSKRLNEYINATCDCCKGPILTCSFSNLTTAQLKEYLDYIYRFHTSPTLKGLTPLFIKYFEINITCGFCNSQTRVALKIQWNYENCIPSDKRLPSIHSKICYIKGNDCTINMVELLTN